MVIRGNRDGKCNFMSVSFLSDQIAVSATKLIDSFWHGWYPVGAVHSLDLTGGIGNVDPRSGDVQRRTTSAPCDKDHSFRADEVRLGYADHRHLFVQRLVQMCSQAWSVLTKPDVTVDDADSLHKA